MQFLVAAIMGGLLQIAGSLVGRVLLALGLSFVTYTGFDLTVTWLLDQVKVNMNSLPIEIGSFLAWLWIDKAIAMMFSAFTVSMLVKTAVAGQLTKMVRKG
jgi:hypothetical protein